MNGQIIYLDAFHWFISLEFATILLYFKGLRGKNEL
jgi:hypothetical protein